MPRFYISDGARPGARIPFSEFGTKSGRSSDILNEAQAIARGRKLVATDAGTPGPPSGPEVIATPIMVNYTLPSGVASASSEPYPQWYPAWAAFNRTTNSETDAWTTLLLVTQANPPSWQWLKFDFGVGNAKYLTKYQLIARNNPGRPYAPKIWIVQGSNDDTAWVDLEAERTKTSWVASEMVEHTLTAPGTYRYVRVLVRESTDVDGLSIGDFIPYAIAA